MSRYLKRVFAKLFFYIAISLLFVQCHNANQPEVHLKASTLVNETHTWYVALDYFSKILHERSDGRIKLDVYHSEQLAKEVESIRLIQAGIIDITTTSSTLNNWIEIAAFCELPFFLRDSTDMQNFLKGAVGKRIEKEMLEVIGLRPLGYFQRGARHLTSNRPIRHPDDLDGLIIRVPNVPSFVTAWSTLGAKPTPMAFSEVFTSLQQGTIEAQENPFALIKSAGFAEVQKYVNLTGHVVSWVYPVIGEKQFQSMAPDLQKIFLEAARDMITYEHRLFLTNERKVKEELKDMGMEFIEVDNKAFSDKCQDAIVNSLSTELKDVYFQVQEMKKTYDLENSK
ncbi:MAG TPA: TRAP transporter substrate-binding protein [Bacteroidales bacterium]|nr:TRAP transporter substrate-binding protein [Bacteroidales bacterium]